MQLFEREITPTMCDDVGDPVLIFVVRFLWVKENGSSPIGNKSPILAYSSV